MQNTKTKVATDTGTHLTTTEAINHLVDHYVPPMPRDESRKLNAVQTKLDEVEPDATIALTKSQWQLLADVFSKHNMPAHRAFGAVIDAVIEKAEEEPDGDDEE